MRRDGGSLHRCLASLRPELFVRLEAEDDHDSVNLDLNGLAEQVCPWHGDLEGADEPARYVERERYAERVAEDVELELQVVQGEPAAKGDALHVDAVGAHILKELVADKGGEVGAQRGGDKRAEVAEGLLHGRAAGTRAGARRCTWSCACV